MNSNPETIPIERYIGIDIHKQSVLVGGQNEKQAWVLRPRNEQMSRFRDWAKKNLKLGGAVVIEATSNAWDIYDIVVPLVSKTVVANAYKVRQIAEARVKTDKEDIKRLITLLIANIVPEVWVPPVHVRELRSLVSFRWRLNKQIATPAPAQTAGAVQACQKIDFTASPALSGIVSSNASISTRQKAKSWPIKTSPGGSSRPSQI